MLQTFEATADSGLVNRSKYCIFPLDLSISSAGQWRFFISSILTILYSRYFCHNLSKKCGLDVSAPKIYCSGILSRKIASIIYCGSPTAGNNTARPHYFPRKLIIFQPKNFAGLLRQLEIIRFYYLCRTIWVTCLLWSI